MSTSFLFFLASYMTYASRNYKGKRAAHDFSVALFTKLVYPCAGARAVVLRGLRDASASCVHTAEAFGPYCAGGLRVREAMPGSTEADWNAFTRALLFLASVADRCAACELTRGQFYRWVADHVDAAAHAEDQRLCMRPVSDRAMYQINGKRCRVDEDLKSLVAEDLIRSGARKSAAQSLRGPFAVATPACGRVWECKSMCVRAAANHLAFETPRSVSCACDAKRLSCPDEDTICYYLWEASVDFACIGAPQVRW